MKVCITLLIVSLLSVHDFYGQALDTGRVVSLPDSSRIEKFKDDIIIKLAIVNTSEILAVEGTNFKQVLQPNPSEVMRAYVNYKFLSFFANYIPHFLPGNNDDAEKGRSHGMGLGTTLNFRSWFTEISYSRTKGYYLENTRDYRPGWKPGDPYIQIPDFYVTSYEGATGYNTNARLSLSAMSTQTERQLRSTGSFIPRISYRYYVIDDRTSSSSNRQKARNMQVLLGAGYHYMFVFKRSLYLLGGFTPSFGYIFTTVYNSSIEPRRFRNNGPVYLWDGRLGLGYNGHRVFSGVYLTATSSKYAQGFTSAANQDARLFLQLLFGFRLRAPKFIRTGYDKVFH